MSHHNFYGGFYGSYGGLAFGQQKPHEPSKCPLPFINLLLVHIVHIFDMDTYLFFIPVKGYGGSWLLKIGMRARPGLGSGEATIEKLCPQNSVLGTKLRVFIILWGQKMGTEDKLGTKAWYNMIGGVLWIGR